MSSGRAESTMHSFFRAYLTKICLTLGMLQVDYTIVYLLILTVISVLLKIILEFIHFCVVHYDVNYAVEISSSTRVYTSRVVNYTLAL